MYRAAITFADLQDDKYLYNAGDIFPRNGLIVSNERIEELAGSNNRTGKPVIVLADEVSDSSPNGVEGILKAQEEADNKTSKPVTKQAKNARKTRNKE